MLLDLLLFLVGLALLLGGGEALVRAASALARELGVPPLVVGLTVVAFGTSAPELAVNVTAALRGDADLSFGNVVGSNLANIGLILGLAAVMRSLQVSGTIITREIPMMLVATATAMVLGLDRLHDPVPESYDASDGLVLLLLFGMFLFYTVAEVLRGRGEDPLLTQAGARTSGVQPRPLAANAAAAAGGLVVLVGGAELTVRGAVDLATALGVPPAVVGLTVVAVGTSLPELATSLVAVRNGQVDLAVGNVVGSNIFNLLFILGTTAVIHRVPVPPGGAVDLLTLLAFSAALLTVGVGRRHRVSRVEGVALLAAYLGYTAWRMAG